jgi:hypothetical protein
MVELLHFAASRWRRVKLKISNFLETECGQTVCHGRKWNPGMRLRFSSDWVKEGTAECTIGDSVNVDRMAVGSMSVLD